MDAATVDPKGLIRESYRIDGITEAECRTIFLDWAIQVPVGADATVHIQGCIDIYSLNQPDHPMTKTLHAGLAPSQKPKRRGGRAAKVSGSN
ncbi:MAG: hypothetical protein AAF386_10940 [Pseudomonadota bacterium]